MTVPFRRVARLQTTVTVPDGRTVLYRLHPVYKPHRIVPADPEQPTLLLVKPAVIEVRETEQKELPTVSTHASTRPASAPLDSSK